MPRWLLISNYKYLLFFFSSVVFVPSHWFARGKNDPNYSIPVAPETWEHKTLRIPNIFFGKRFIRKKIFFTTRRWWVRWVRWGGNVKFIWSIVSYLNKISRDSRSTFLGFYYFIWRHLQILKYLLSYSFQSSLLVMCGFRKEAFCFLRDLWLFNRYLMNI